MKQPLHLLVTALVVASPGYGRAADKEAIGEAPKAVLTKQNASSDNSGKDRESTPQIHKGAVFGPTLKPLIKTGNGDLRPASRGPGSAPAFENSRASNIPPKINAAPGAALSSTKPKGATAGVGAAPGVGAAFSSTKPKGAELLGNKSRIDVNTAATVHSPGLPGGLGDRDLVPGGTTSRDKDLKSGMDAMMNNGPKVEESGGSNGNGGGSGIGPGIDPRLAGTGGDKIRATIGDGWFARKADEWQGPEPKKVDPSKAVTDGKPVPDGGLVLPDYDQQQAEKAKKLEAEKLKVEEAKKKPADGGTRMTTGEGDRGLQNPEYRKLTVSPDYGPGIPGDSGGEGEGKLFYAPGSKQPAAEVPHTTGDEPSTPVLRDPENRNPTAGPDYGPPIPGGE